MKYKHKFILSLFFLFSLLSLAYFLAPAVVHAQNLHVDLTYPGSDDTAWVFLVWKIMLGIANTIIILVLLFLAAVNILHLQYDTYQVKKSLPALIGGIIAANFSILICRMIVDAAQVLTATFANDPATLVRNYLSVFMINPDAANSTGGVVLSNFAGVGGIIILIVLLVIIAIVILVLAFLLWIRKIVIFFLVAVSPVAFILYAFPPTQGVFKQWWSQFIKWVFMGPILMMIFWIGSQVGAARNDQSVFSISAALTVVFLSIVACMVPFKLGGAVMGAWGKAGQWASGTGKEGYLRKPADKWVGDKKEAAKLRANNWANKNTALGRWRAGHEMEMETLKGENKAILEKRQAEARVKRGSKQALREAEIANSTSILEEEKTKQTLAVESGNFNHISKRQMKKITGESDHMNVAQKYIEQANKTKQMQEGLAKRRDLDLQNLSVRDLREDDKFRNQLESIGDRIESSEFDESGEKLAVGALPIKITFDRSIEVAEELRFKAKSETDPDKRKELVEAANHFENKAKEFKSTHKKDVSGNDINYDGYLSRNLSGRRQKILNPAIEEEAKVQVMSTTHTGLVTDTQKDPITGKKQTFGTSEWRGDSDDMDNAFNGKLHKSSSTAAYAAMVQARAMMKVMDTAKQGDVEGLEVMQLFCDRAKSAGRKNFKKMKALEALKKMDPTNRAQIEKQAAVSTGKDWADLTATEKRDAIEKIDFSKLDVTSSGAGKEGRAANANRAFIKRFLAGIETDKKLGFSKSPGTVLRKSQ